MKFDNKNITFSKRDGYRGITLPKKLDEDLAYLLGFHLGDGHMKQAMGKTGLGSAIFYDGYSINEFAQYKENICPLIKRLFNCDCKIEVRKNSNNLRTKIGSRAIVDFLHIQFGFLRGLADTDMSLVFKSRHKDINYYPVIDCSMKSKFLVLGVIELLKKMGYSFHSGSKKSMRYSKIQPHSLYYFQINGVKNLEKWMKEIGFSSPNQLTKLDVWKKYGFLPPKTTIVDRIKMIEK